MPPQPVTLPAQGIAFFPGVFRVIGASIDDVHGISPSAALLRIVPQPDLIALTGDLEFRLGERRRVWRDARVDSNRLERTQQGHIWQLTVLDRRWKWTLGAISGHWNTRLPDGSVDPETEKTPKELAKLLLEAAGESGFDIDDLPNDARPSVFWESDVAMEQLANLVDQLGVRIILGLDDKVHLRVAGVGAELPQAPSDPIIQNSATLDLPERPDKLVIVCGHTLVQAHFQLEAIGEERDGRDVLVDDLTYKPTAGWEQSVLAAFQDIPNDAGATEEERTRTRALAQRSVYRRFRIMLPDVPKLRSVSGEDVETTSIEQLLPLENKQVDTRSRFDVNQRVIVEPQPPVVYGKWWEQRNNRSANTVETVFQLGPTILPGRGTLFDGFSLDPTTGIVTFPQPIYANATPDGDELTVEDPTLRLVVAFKVRRLKADGAYPVRHSISRVVDATGTKEALFKRPELIETQTIRYRDSIRALITEKVDLNQPEIDNAAAAYLDTIEASFQTKTPQTIVYDGLVPIELDGAIQHVTYIVGIAGGASTVVSRDNERVTRIIPYRERRMLEQLREPRRQWTVNGKPGALVNVD